MENGVADIVYKCIFAVVGLVMLCSFAIPIFAEYMGKLGLHYAQYVPILGIIPMLLIIFLATAMVRSKPLNR
jgi:hypothetical protein